MTAGAPGPADVGELGDDAWTAEGVLMCGGAPEIVGVILEAACVLLGVVGLAAVLGVVDAVAVLVDAPLLVLPRRGAKVFVDNWMISLPWTARLSLDFFRSRVSVSVFQTCGIR